MSLLSLKLFGHCSTSGDEAIGSDYDGDEVVTLGINEATGLPLVSNGVKGSPGVIDVAGSIRGTDMTDHSDLNSMHDVSTFDNDMTCGIDTHIETDWECGTSFMESGIDDFACNDLSEFESDW